MGVCIPNCKSQKIADVSSAINKQALFQQASKKNHRHSFFNANFLQNQRNPTKITQEKVDEEEFLRFLKVKHPNKNKYSHMNSPLLRAKRESFHNSRNDTSMRTLEVQSLKRLVSHSIKLFNNRVKNLKIMKEPETIENNKGTMEFLKHRQKSIEILQNFDCFIPSKNTIHQEMKNTLPNLQIKIDQNTKNPKNEENRSVSVNKKSGKVDKNDETNNSATISRRKMGSVGDVSMISQSKILNNSASVRIRPDGDYKKLIENKSQNSALLRALEKLKKGEDGKNNNNIKVLHEGKVVILKKNNFIIRNDRILKVI